MLAVSATSGRAPRPNLAWALAKLDIRNEPVFSAVARHGVQSQGGAEGMLNCIICANMDYTGWDDWEYVFTIISGDVAQKTGTKDHSPQPPKNPSPVPKDSMDNVGALGPFRMTKHGWLLGGSLGGGGMVTFILLLCFFLHLPYFFVFFVTGIFFSCSSRVHVAPPPPGGWTRPV